MMPLSWCVWWGCLIGYVVNVTTCMLMKHTVHLICGHIVTKQHVFCNVWRSLCGYDKLVFIFQFFTCCYFKINRYYNTHCGKNRYNIIFLTQFELYHKLYFIIFFRTPVHGRSYTSTVEPVKYYLNLIKLNRAIKHKAHWVFF